MMSQFSESDLAKARSRLDLVLSEVPMKRAGRELIGRCPFHLEKTPSFRLYADGHHHCFGCGAHGTVIDFMMRQHNLAFPDAVREILGQPERPVRWHSALPPVDPGGVSDRGRDRSADVREILNRCTHVTERTEAWLYLHLRGLSGVKQDALLAHPSLYCDEIKANLPALIAPITNSIGETTAVQRIWVLPKVEYTHDRQPKDSRPALQIRKKTYGPMAEGAVRLRGAKRTIGLCEGVETALAAMAIEVGVPVWAVCGAQRLARIWLPSIVERVIIFGDNGPIGQSTAFEAEAAWQRRGIDAEARFPDPRYDDFNTHLLDPEHYGQRGAST